MENKKGKAQLNRLFVELHVPDFSIAEDFYKKLGFEIASYDKVYNGLGYFLMQRGETIINFYGGSDKVYEQSFFKKFSKGTPRGFEVEITIPTDNIDEYFKAVKMNIPDNIVQELMKKTDKKSDTKEFVWRDFRVEDPFGFYLRFTEPIFWKECYCGSNKDYRKCHGK